ncbi:MAG: TRAP transporter substrate-binding protein DctP [Bacteriovoracaceae bacterium]|nr:TRAP transporter substrate-binding protein DctP [Bacteriovoracaceae bacterium]
MAKLLLPLFLLLCPDLYAVNLKIGVLAPEGTSWAQNIKKMVKEIKTKTDNKVNLKIFYGATAGDEPVVLRKIRIGQLQGGIFTGKTLGDINGDVRVIEIPFTFGHDRKKAWSIVEHLTPNLNKEFKKSGFENLGFYEIGHVYLVSKKKIQNINSLKGIKIWSWEGDPLVQELISIMKLVSIPLPLPDVLTSLSTEIIEAAYSPPLAIIALQWNTKVKYLLDYPITYSIGAFLLSNKAWSKIPSSYRQVVRSITTKYLNKITEANAQENIDALNVLKGQEIKFIQFPETDYQQFGTFRLKMINNLKGKIFSAEIYNNFQNKLNTL